MYSQSESDSTVGVRLVDLDTGELSSGSFDELVGQVFASVGGAADRAFLSPQQPRARSAPLGKTAISGRAREKLICKVYADMVQVGQVEAGDDEGEDDRLSPRSSEAGKRGLVMGFSRRSRSRMIQECARVRDVDNGFFLTLTFPDLVVSAFETVEEMASWAKGVWAVMRHRLTREFKRGGAIWRMELMDRKSGDFVGLLVPHFHVLLFCGEGVPLMFVQDWLRSSWSEVVGLADEEFVEHGTLAWAINDRRHVMAYASKYAAKVEGDNVAAGRRWGKCGKLDQSAVLSVEMSVEQLVQFKRYQRAWLRSRGGYGYAKVLARLPASYGGYLLGLGDMSSKVGWMGNLPTILRMLAAVGVDV